MNTTVTTMLLLHLYVWLVCNKNVFFFYLLSQLIKIEFFGATIPKSLVLASELLFFSLVRPRKLFQDVTETVTGIFHYFLTFKKQLFDIL